MIERPQIATMYVWQKNQPFDMDYLVFLLGGIRPPTDAELAVHHFGRPMHCTDDFKLYHSTKEQDAEAHAKYEHVKDWHPHFSTMFLEGRLSKYGLSVPDNEVVFLPRGVTNADGIDAMKARAAAAHLAVYSALDLLLVPGASIEQDQYLASEPIAQKLGIPVVPE